MKALIEAEIVKIGEEIQRLEDVAARLTNLLAQADETPQPKKRGRKPKKVGLPSAVPPASEAKL